jgi:uncharacterized protein YceK
MKKVYLILSIITILSGCSTPQNKQINEQKHSQAVSGINYAIEAQHSTKGEMGKTSEMMMEVSEMLQQDYKKRILALDIKHKMEMDSINRKGEESYYKNFESMNNAVSELRASLKKINDTPEQFTSDEIKLVQLNLDKSLLELEIKKISVSSEMEIKTFQLIANEISRYELAKVVASSWLKNEMELLEFRSKMQAELNLLKVELEFEKVNILDQIENIESQDLEWGQYD